MIVLRYVLEKGGSGERADVYRLLLFSLILIILPALALGIGSVVHSIRESFAGFVAVLIGGVLLFCYFALSFLGFAVFTGWLNALVISCPGLLAGLTVFFAIRSRALSRTPIR